ncbi:MAG: hypothetical protein KJI69_01435 [Patescibacteria group bacterium]|nr:hypothetical protein [Patescibacteria group bacterium]
MPVRVRKKEETEDQWSFVVEVGTNSDDTTGFLVRVDKEHWKNLTGGKYPPELLVGKSFRFLLKREPCSSIQRDFNIKEITQFFPGYENEMYRIFRVY